MAAWYVESTKAAGLRFKILKLDKATMNAQLLGETGVPFEKVLTQDVLDKFGFRIAKQDEALPAIEAQAAGV